MSEEMTIVNMNRRILWEPVEEPAPSLEEFQASLPEDPDPSSTHDLSASTTIETHTLVLPEGSTLIVQPKRAYKKRVGNGHKSQKIRDLTSLEKGIIRTLLFIPKDGQIDDDDCITIRDGYLTSVIGVFQVTGFVSVLHTDVAQGILQLKDLASYEKWMSSKYGGSLWARYNNPKFIEVRNLNLNATAMGMEPVHKVSNVQVSLIPKFKTFKKKWSK